MDATERWLDNFCRVVVLNYDRMNQETQHVYRDIWRHQAEPLRIAAIETAAEPNRSSR